MKRKMSFGKVIVEAREKALMKQKDLAARIKKKDGSPITTPYLNDIEHDRRTPSSEHLIKQFSEILNIPIEVLYYHAQVIPPKAYKSWANTEQIVSAFKKFYELR